MRWKNTVKVRIISILMIFTVTIAILVSVFSGYMIRDFQARTLAQSVESSLGIIAGNIERDLIELIALTEYYRSPSGPAAGYYTQPYSDIAAMAAFKDFNTRYFQNRVSNHIYRAIATSNDGTRILHTGTSAATILTTLDNESIQLLERWTPLEQNVRIHSITPDPFSRGEQFVLPLVGPVVQSYAGSSIGIVYVAVKPSLFTDAAAGLSETDRLYVTIGDTSFQINRRDITPVEIFEEGAFVMQKTVHEDIVLTQVSLVDGMADGNHWLMMLFGILALIVFMAILMIWYLNRTISRPVGCIRSKIAAISEGDFSYDASIESDSEIGEVGRGINQLSSSVLELMQTRLADEQRKRDLEYRALQSQIDPHFLYNTLNSIKWMATFQKADGIAEMVTALSRLLKTIAKDLRETVTVEEELALLDDYFVIMKYRYGGAITYERICEDPAALCCKLPRFVLQPLMENAIFHGLEPKGRGMLRLRVAREGDDLCISLWDNGVGMSEETMEAIRKRKPKEGEVARSVGISNVHERIQYVFGEAYGVSIDSVEGAYTNMRLTIPFQS